MTESSLPSQFIVEGSTRIITDRVNPAETIFWLKNRAPDRWKDKPVSAPTSKDGKPLIPVEALKSLFDDDD